MDDFDFLTSDMDLDFDFDLGDFDMVKDDTQQEPRKQRILKPRVDVKLLDTRMVSFENAREFVRNIDLTGRTYAWLDGSFIFGEIPEALGEIGHPVKRAWITSLGLSEENIDSLYNCFALYGLDKLCLLLSAYFYSHEKYKIIPYMYEKLDVEIETEQGKWEPGFQVGFFNIHTKIMCLELEDGTKLTLHGSSNLRSSNCLEQAMIETDPEIFDFNREIIRELMKTFFTINHDFGEGRRIRPLRNGITKKIIRKVRR